MKVVNLLPPAEQQILNQEKILGNVRSFIYLSLLSYVLLFATMFGFRSYLLGSVSNLDSEIQKTKDIISKQNNNALKTEIEYNNNLVLDYNKLYQGNPKWSGVLVDFAKLVPAGVVVNSFTADTNTGRVDIAGKSALRDSVLLLRQNILASSDFKNIDLPFDNIAKPVNVDFHYTFYLNENILGPGLPAPLPKVIKPAAAPGSAE